MRLQTLQEVNHLNIEVVAKLKVEECHWMSC